MRSLFYPGLAGDLGFASQIQGNVVLRYDVQKQGGYKLEDDRRGYDDQIVWK